MANNTFCIILTICWFLPGAIFKPKFSRFPPTKQYVLHGTNALFEWDYNNDSYILDFAKWGKIGGSLPYFISSDRAGVVRNSDAKKYALTKPAGLQLINVTSSSTGKYYCLLNFNHATKFDPVVLESEADLQVVRSAPDFTSSLPKKQIGREGTSEVKLSVVVKGDQTPLVTWYRNDGLADTTIFTVTSGVVGTNVENETIVQSNLTINHPNRTSNSVFLAKAAYGTFSPVSNTSTVLDVWYGPENIRFSSSKSGVAVAKNEIVTITCTGNANPAPTFTIYRNQTILLNDSASGSYTINSFDAKDAGNYSCLVKNDVSSKLIGGVMFMFNESKVIYTTASPTTTPLITSTVAEPTSPGKITASASRSLPWWMWLIIAIAIVIVLFIPIAVIFYFKRKRQRSEKSKRFSSHGDYFNYHKQNTPYSMGYENKVEKELEPSAPNSAYSEREIKAEASRDHELARENLGMKFESEHDLIEHYIKGPEKSDDEDPTDVDIKDYDPFESDDDLASTPKESYGDEIGIHYDSEDAIKMNSESEPDETMEAEPYVDIEDEIIQYNI